MSGYVKGFDEIECMTFQIKDHKLLKDKIWDIISNSIKKRFDSKPVYNEKYLKTKLKLYEAKIIQILMIIECLMQVFLVFFSQ